MQVQVMGRPSPEFPVVCWTPEKLERLRKLYEAEKDEGLDHVIEFDGTKMLIAYTKYMIEYLTKRFEGCSQSEKPVN